MSKKRALEVEFDSNNIKVGKVRRHILKSVLKVLRFFLMSFTLTVLIYLLFALFFKTDVERKLSREIKVYKEIYPSLTPREALLSDAVSYLQYKDNEIYNTVFHSTAPNVDPARNLGLLESSEEIPVTRLSTYTRKKADALVSQAADVDKAFELIFATLKDSAFVCPPMCMPLEDISYPQIGASLGQKMNPLYKAYVQHNGLDFIVLRGTPVYATADGIVESASSAKSTGYSIVIKHSSGYTTTYSHLEKMQVRAGQKVTRGQQIATVGMSGQSFAPHLHYEIRLAGAALDPVNYLFASVSPTDYANMLYMAVNTKQSMD